jgi:hypothetical protein
MRETKERVTLAWQKREPLDPGSLPLQLTGSQRKLFSFSKIIHLNPVYIFLQKRHHFMETKKEGFFKKLN